MTESGRSRAFRVDPLVLVTVFLLGAATLVLTFLSDGNLGAALAPLALGLVVLAARRAPLRHSLLILGFLCLTLESPGEVFASGKWHTPFRMIGSLMLAHLNITFPFKPLIFSGTDVALVMLAGIWAWRRMTASSVDMAGHIPPASPLRQAALLCLATIFWVWGVGLLKGGADFGNSLWQVARVIYLPAVVLLSCAALRGPVDARPFAIALLVAALLRAGLAAYVRYLFPNTEEVPHATTHPDSMLFANAFVMMLAIFFERPTRRSLALMFATLPLLSWGMIANNRRLVWVELLVVLFVLYLITPFNRLKRRLAQALVIALPIVALYVGVGWNTSSRIFAPVQTIRSLIDAKVDASTLWRDMENFDLFYTLRSNPLFGTGFGHGYDEIVHLPDISSAYQLYRFAPHNSVLGLLTYCGFIGFTGIWLMIPVGLFLAVRCYRFATTPCERSTALFAVGILVTYVVHCYGDMGLGTFTSVFTIGPALALVAKQAVATGAWPLAARRGQVQPSAGSVVG
jgi:hypothetical protein